MDQADFDFNAAYKESLPTLYGRKQDMNIRASLLVPSGLLLVGCLHDGRVVGYLHPDDLAKNEEVEECIKQVWPSFTKS